MSQTETKKKKDEDVHLDDSVEKSDPAYDSVKELDKILKGDDGQDYLKITELAGQTTKQHLYEHPTDRAKWIADYNAWLMSDKPKPKMPVPTANVRIPSSLVRFRDRGVEYVYTKYQDGSADGITYTTNYAVETDPQTGQKVQTNIVESRTPEYTQPFDERYCRGVIEQAKKLVPPEMGFVLYLKTTNGVHILSEKNFFRNYDDIVRDIAAKQVLD